MNKCPTCKHCGNDPSWYGHFHECDRLSIERDRMINVAGSALPLALVPDDFGCVYHEARPILVKPVCDTCCYWDRACGHWGSRLRCTVRSTDNFAVLTAPHTTCFLWEQYHG